MQLSRFISPVCLFLALVLIIAAFAMLALDAPGESVQLQAVRANGDELAETALSTTLARQQFLRHLLLAILFFASFLLVVLSFLGIGGKS